MRLSLLVLARKNQKNDDCLESATGPLKELMFECARVFNTLSLWTTFRWFAELRVVQAARFRECSYPV